MADSYECEKRAYLVIGNLTVNGFLNMCGDDVGYPIQLYVTGNLKAKNISIATLSELVVLGNIKVEDSFLAIDPAFAQIYCGGDLSINNKAYIDEFPLTVKGKLKCPNFYVEIRQVYNFDVPLEELINIVNMNVVDDEILAIENGETDFTDEEIENIYSKNQIFTPEFEVTDIYYDNIEFFKKGKNIWNN